MITLNAVHARIGRQKIQEFSGDNFLHRKDILKTIPCLEKYASEQFLFGIYENQEKWTVVSVCPSSDKMRHMDY